MTVIKLEEALNLESRIFIDVRSPQEYEIDHIPGSINIPLLDNDERAIIGTLYKKQGKEDALEKGMEYVTPKLQEFYDQIKAISQEYKNVIIYCFRGGMRSSSFVDFINSRGLNVKKLDQGYKYYRNYVIKRLDDLSDFKFVVLHGHTGIGKTEMLIELEKKGLSILDLEYFAKNSGSVFGGIYYSGNPVSQKYFETQILEKLLEAEKNGVKHLFMESESKKIGRCTLGSEFWNQMTNGYHILVEASLDSRVERCVKDYTLKCIDNDEQLISSIKKLKDTIGNVGVELLIEKSGEKDYSFVARYLMENYYDKLYLHSQDKYKYEFAVDSEAMKNACDSIELWYNNIRNI